MTVNPGLLRSSHEISFHQWGRCGGLSKEPNLEQRNQYKFAQEHSTVCVFRRKKKKKPRLRGSCFEDHFRNQFCSHDYEN